MTIITLTIKLAENLYKYSDKSSESVKAGVCGSLKTDDANVCWYLSGVCQYLNR